MSDRNCVQLIHIFGVLDCINNILRILSTVCALPAKGRKRHRLKFIASGTQQKHQYNNKANNTPHHKSSSQNLPFVKL